MTEIYLEHLLEATKSKQPSAPAKPLRAKPSFIEPSERVEKDRGVYGHLKQILDKAGNKTIKYTQGGLVEFNYFQLSRALDRLDNMPGGAGMGSSAMIYGEAGIGKSALVEQRAKARANELGRTYITLENFIKKFNKIDDVKANLKSHFIFIGLLATSLDQSMIAGIPDPTSVERQGFLTELTVPWASLMSMSEDAVGFMFMDELNQADMYVQNSLFSMTNFGERTIIMKYPILGDWRIHCAGNWGKGYSVTPLVKALKERLVPCYLKLDFHGWAEWAQKSTISKTDLRPIIHPLLMDFIDDDPENNFYESPTGDENATRRPNPRNLVALSGMIYSIIGEPGKHEPVDRNQWEDLISQAGLMCGDKFGKDFEEYCSASALVDVGDVLSDPGRLVKQGTAAGQESQIMQMISVFKRNFKRHVIQFDNVFEAAEPEKKRALVNEALEYLNVLYQIYDTDEATVTNVFSSVANPRNIHDLEIYRGQLIKYLRSVGKDDAAKWVINLISEIANDAGAAVGTFMGEEEEEETTSNTPEIDPATARKVTNILGAFQQKVRTGKFTQFV
jgi:hypothetical protein